MYKHRLGFQCCFNWPWVHKCMLISNCNYPLTLRLLNSWVASTASGQCHWGMHISYCQYVLPHVYLFHWYTHVQDVAEVVQESHVESYQPTRQAVEEWCTDDYITDRLTLSWSSLRGEAFLWQGHEFWLIKLQFKLFLMYAHTLFIIGNWVFKWSMWICHLFWRYCSLIDQHSWLL